MGELLECLLSQQPQFRSARLGSLYSDFRLQQTINPDGYAANVDAWEKGLSLALKSGAIPGWKDVLSLRAGTGLLQVLESKEWGKPQALRAVFEESASRGSMIPLGMFLKASNSIYGNSWTTKGLKLISWSWQQIGLGARVCRQDGLPEEQFVMIENVEEAATKIGSKLLGYQSRVERILPMEVFRQEVEQVLGLGSGISASDLKILLVYLDRDKKLLVYNREVVKIKGSKEEEAMIESQDKSIAALKSLMAELNVQLERTTVKMHDLSTRARVAITQQNKTSALASLRLKKLQETTFARRSETLVLLEDIFSKIVDVADQVETVKVMKTSSQMLKRFHAEIGGIDNVEAVIEELREEMTKANEINSIINNISEGSDLDETAIDEELNALIKDAAFKNEWDVAQKTKRKLALLDKLPLRQITNTTIPESLGPIDNKTTEKSPGVLTTIDDRVTDKPGLQTVSSEDYSQSQGEVLA